MKRTALLRNLAIFAGLVVVLPLGLFVWYVQRDINRIYRADHQSLLVACRELIAARTNYGAYRLNLPYDPRSTNWVELNEQFIATNSIPSVIRKLRPKAIWIYEDSAQIFMHAPRTSVLAFAEGVHQYGTYKLMDGLWFWNGHEPGRNYGELAGREEKGREATDSP